jgi:hypothetical protein
MKSSLDKVIQKAITAFRVNPSGHTGGCFPFAHETVPRIANGD